MTEQTIYGFRGKHYVLSNFSRGQDFAIPGLMTPAKTGEHAFQALKTLDPAEQAWVLEADTPNEAKRRGRRVSMQPGWEHGVRDQAMLTTVWAKFTQPALREALLDTGNAVLVEANTWHDCYWGVCTCPRHHGQGYNQLGLALMYLRSALR